MTYLQSIYLSKMVIFHRYIKLEEGNSENIWIEKNNDILVSNIVGKELETTPFLVFFEDLG